MKKVILVFIAMLALLIPLFSTPAAASVYEMTEYDTGIKAPLTPEGQTDPALIILSWKFEACWHSFFYGVAEISYRHTSPKHSDGGFGPILEQGGSWDGTYWYGWIEFNSWIDGGKKGTNHGDIEITFSNGYPQVITWSFNVRHS